MGFQVGDFVVIKKKQAINDNFYKRRGIDKHGEFEIIRVKYPEVGSKFLPYAEIKQGDTNSFSIYLYIIELVKTGSCDLEEFM